VRFWSYLIGALWTVEPDFGDQALATLPSPGPSLVEGLLPLLLNDLASLSRRVLVLDDHLDRRELIHAPTRPSSSAACRRAETASLVNQPSPSREPRLIPADDREYRARGVGPFPRSARCVEAGVMPARYRARSSRAGLLGDALDGRRNDLFGCRAIGRAPV
jgi:hypothetical protein